MNNEFEKVFAEVLNSPTLTDVEKHGKPCMAKAYVNESGQEIDIIVYEFDSKMYLIKHVDRECVRFLEI